MKISGCFSSSVTIRRMAGSVGAAILAMTTSVALAQMQPPGTPTPAPDPAPVVPQGYTIQESVDLGGHMVGLSGSGSMYDTMVNMQSGMRMLGDTFTMRALPGNKNPVFDSLTGFTNGFGGDPNNFAKLDFYKGKLYEFSGTFRRDRQYFDYDLLANPNIPSGYSIPIGPSTAPTGSYAWPQAPDSPFMYNTVRHMTDTNLTVLPLSKVTLRFGYAQNIFAGPSLTPSGNSVAGQELLLQEIQRNSTDDFFGAIDWKPVRGTMLSYQEQIDHYKGDSYMVMDPAYYTVQESDGTKAALLDSYQTLLPYGYSSTTGAFNASNCNSSSMISTSTILRVNPNGGLPIIDPACSVITSYVRNQPTREIFPTEIFRLQSSSIKNVSMNGNVRYTSAKMNLPDYNEDFQGLDGADRSIAYTGFANAKRETIAADYGIVWQASKTVSLADQVSFSNVHQPGTAEFTSGTTETVPTTAGEETINYTGLTSTTTTTCTTTNGKTTCTAPFEGGAYIASPATGYFGQRWVTNNATVSWDATARSTFSLTYRHSNHVITEGANVSTAVPSGACPAANPPGSEGGLQAYCGTVTINENGGIFNAALRPTENWNINGSVEMLYNDNVFTPVAPRQTQQYRLHTLYRPKPWATISGSYNDLERHNNTNNTDTASPSYVGPLDHVDHSRFLGLGADLMPSERFGVDLDYDYTDVYTATNTCYQGAATLMPGGTNVPAAASQSGVLCATITSTHGTSLLFQGRDFMDAPTQYGSLALALSPANKLHSDIGYRLTSVDGSRFFSNAQEVNGTLVSTYQSPFVNLTYTMRPGLTWKAEYNFYGYGEGGASGAQYCNDNPSLSSGAAGSSVPSSAIVPCSSVPNTALSGPAYGFSAPRNYHANMMTLGVHYEFGAPRE